MELEDINLSPPKTIKLDGKEISLTERVERHLRTAYVSHMEEELKKSKALAKSILDQTVSQYKAKEVQMEEILRRSFPIPEEDFLQQNQIQMSVREGYLHFYLLFRYAPTSIDGKRIRNPEELRRDIRIHIKVEGTVNKSIKEVELLNKSGSKFDHYHNYIYGDCLGRINLNKMVKDIEDIIRYRDRIQDLYSTIHLEDGGERNHRNPPGLPPLSSIKTVDEEVLWTHTPPIATGPPLPTPTPILDNVPVWHVPTAPQPTVYAYQGMAEYTRTLRRRARIGSALSAVFIAGIGLSLAMAILLLINPFGWLIPTPVSEPTPTPIEGTPIPRIEGTPIPTPTPTPTNPLLQFEEKYIEEVK